MKLDAEIAVSQLLIEDNSRLLTGTTTPADIRRLRLRLLDLTGALDQDRAERKVLQKVTDDTITLAVDREVALARTAVQVAWAEKRQDFLKAELKREPHDVDLKLSTLSAAAGLQKARSELELLREGRTGKDLRRRLLNVTIQVTQGQLQAVKALLTKDLPAEDRARVRERLARLEVDLQAATKEHELLLKDKQANPGP
jgi:hypothetical protein